MLSETSDFVIECSEDCPGPSLVVSPLLLLVTTRSPSSLEVTGCVGLPCSPLVLEVVPPSELVLPPACVLISTKCEEVSPNCEIISPTPEVISISKEGFVILLDCMTVSP